MDEITALQILKENNYIINRGMIQEKETETKQETIAIDFLCAEYDYMVLAVEEK